MTDRIDYAARAQNVLDAITTYEDNFKMSWWFTPGGGKDGRKKFDLEPDAEITCGTTMCVAGWAAHLDGWKLRAFDSDAEKDGVRRAVASVGLEYLGLHNDALFFVSETEAKIFLTELAKGRDESEIYDDYYADVGAFSVAAQEEFLSA